MTTKRQCLRQRDEQTTLWQGRVPEVVVAVLEDNRRLGREGSVRIGGEKVAGGGAVNLDHSARDLNETTQDPSLGVSRDLKQDRKAEEKHLMDARRTSVGPFGSQGPAIFKPRTGSAPSSTLGRMGLLHLQ
jgi:hypothetical protein